MVGTFELLNQPIQDDELLTFDFDHHEVSKRWVKLIFVPYHLMTPSSPSIVSNSPDKKFIISTHRSLSVKYMNPINASIAVES